MLASLSSLHARFYGIVSDEINPKEIGAYQRWQWKIIIQRYLKSRRNLSWTQARSVVDYSFDQVTKHPLDTVKDIYYRLGLELTAEALNKMQNWLEKDLILGKKGASGLHEYKPEWFGLDPKAIEADFEEYTSTYLT